MKTNIVQVLALALALGSFPEDAAGQTKFSTVYTFTNGDPTGLTYANGVFYGTTFTPTENCGTVFELQPPAVGGGAWSETVLYSFDYNSVNGDACRPIGPPVMGPNGALLGVTSQGGDYNFGAAYELQPPASSGGAWTETVIFSFESSFTALAGQPTAAVMGPNGSLYVTTTDGGVGVGAAVQLRPPAVSGGTWTGILLYSFESRPDGETANSLTLGPKGVLFGTTEYGGSGWGTVFELVPPVVQGGAWTETVLYSFSGGADGDVPIFVTPGPGGVLYGTAHPNGGQGTVFQLTPPSSTGGSWTKTTLAQIGTDYLCGPDSPLIVRKGNIYGTTCITGGGAVFELLPPSTPGAPWTNNTLYTFANGQIPGGSFVMTAKGIIFGATDNPSSQPPGGTVYALAP